MEARTAWVPVSHGRPALQAVPVRVSRREDVRVTHQKGGGTEACGCRLCGASSCIRQRVPSAPTPVHAEHTATMRDPNSRRIAVKSDLWVAPREPVEGADWRERDRKQRQHRPRSM